MSDASEFLSPIENAASTSGTPINKSIYQYARAFNPKRPEEIHIQLSTSALTMRGDQTDGLEYVYNEEIILAVNIALATDRPLLVSGPPGSGKSSLARSVAKWLGWRYYEQVITSRTQARDLQWHFDALHRLGDAQVAGADKNALERLQNNFNYINPGVLWWAFDPESASRRGMSGVEPTLEDPAIDLGPPPQIVRPEESNLVASYASHNVKECAIVLLDEIDKTDPDVPNDLLIPLGSFKFTIAETHTDISLKGKALLIIITTNGERELPDAFRRRCLTLTLPKPTVEGLVQIAKCHFGDDDESRYQAIANQTILIQGDNENSARPGTAEFLDAVQASKELDIYPDDRNSTWEAVKLVTLLKGHATERVF